LKTKTVALLLGGLALLLLPAGAAAAAADYFPLLEGNQWIYRQLGIGAGEPITVEVIRRDSLGGQVYFLVRGFEDGDLWLRKDAEGTLLIYDPQVSRERVWAVFGAPEGSTFQTEVAECNELATLVSRNARYEGLLGSFTWALQIDYLPGQCADAGLEREVYLPWVGLMERTVTTIAGPRRFELIYARLSGITFISEPNLGFSVTLNQRDFKLRDERWCNGAPTLRARLTLRNHFLPPIALTFPTGQRFDLVIRNAAGDVVYQWSDGRSFTEAIMQVEFGHGEENFVVETALVDRDGTALHAGDYQVEAWLTNSEGGEFRATTAFRIVDRWFDTNAE